MSAAGISATEIFTDLPEGITVATSALQQKANDVRATKMNWTSYLQVRIRCRFVRPVESPDYLRAGWQ